MSDFHTFVTLTIASKDGTGWTADGVIKEIPVIVMGSSAVEVLAKISNYFPTSPDNGDEQV